MKTISENANRNSLDKTSNKKGGRKFLQTLQPSGGDKENLVGAGRSLEKISAQKAIKPQVKTEVVAKPEVKKSVIAKVNPSLYKKLIVDDLTTINGPSEKYWQVIAERRRKALEEVIEENHKLHALVKALEEENASCKNLLEQTTDIVNFLKEIINDDEEQSKDDNEDNNNSTESEIDEQENSHSIEEDEDNVEGNNSTESNINEEKYNNLTESKTSNINIVIDSTKSDSNNKQ